MGGGPCGIKGALADLAEYHGNLHKHQENKLTNIRTQDRSRKHEKNKWNKNMWRDARLEKKIRMLLRGKSQRRVFHWVKEKDRQRTRWVSEKRRVCCVKKNVQGLLSSDEVAKRIRESTSKVDAASTTSRPKSEASSTLRAEAEHKKTQAEALQALWQERASKWQFEGEKMVQEKLPQERQNTYAGCAMPKDAPRTSQKKKR